MKRIVHITILVILFLALNLQFEQNEVIERGACPESYRRERRACPDFLGRERFFLVDSINSMNSLNQPNQLNQSNQSNQFNLIDSINLFSQSRAWSQEPKTQAGERSIGIPESYIIGQGDMLEVFVWRNQELSRQVVVRPDGKISLPLVQDVQAEALTAFQLRDQITRRLKQYVQNPTVTVIVSQINSYRISVLGKVASPGVYAINLKTTLLEAISMAGGLTEWAKKRKMTVIRNEGGKKQKFVINYKKIISGKDPSQNIVLQRGDTIIVP